MTPEQIHDSSSLRSPLSPPEGPINFARSIFWNECELRAGWRFLIYLLFVVLFTMAGTFLATALHFPQIDRTGITATSMLVHECVRVITTFAAAAIMGILEARPFGGYGLPHAAAFGARFWQGAAWGIAMIAVIIFLIGAFGGFSFGDLALRGSVLWGYAVLWAVVFLFVGFFEEFLFRGYAQFTLADGIGFWPAAIFLSALFGAIHLANGGENWRGALSVMFIGLIFAFALRRTGNLWFVVGLHAAFDLGETFLFSVPDSGMRFEGHLSNATLTGSHWITGGSVGPEGSLFSFLTMGCVALFIHFAFPARKTALSTNETPTPFLDHQI